MAELCGMGMPTIQYLARSAHVDVLLKIAPHDNQPHKNSTPSGNWQPITALQYLQCYSEASDIGKNSARVGCCRKFWVFFVRSVHVSGMTLN